MTTGMRKMTERDLDLVRSWRNHADVRKFMYTQHEITAEEHRAWFERSVLDDSRHLLIYERNGTPLGFVAFTPLASNSQIADWGFYVAPGATGGVGRELGKSALDYAFGEISLHKVNGQALGYNERSIRFHERLGFKLEGRLRQQHFDGKEFHDIVLFGLLSIEWQPGGKE